jgi:hypothetical protein
MTVYVTRLFGGRNIGVTWDGANITIIGQSLAVSTLSPALQAQWQNAVATVALPGAPNTSKGALGGDNISAAVGSIMDNQPAWENAIRAALANYASGISGVGGVGQQIADPESYNR